MAALIAAKTGLEALDAIATTPSPFVRSTLFAGLVVNYARAFEPANNQESRLSRSFPTRGIDGFDRVAHESLLTLRNQYLAHAGHSQNDYTLMFVKLDLHPEGRALMASRSPPSSLVRVGRPRSSWMWPPKMRCARI